MQGIHVSLYPFMHQLRHFPALALPSFHASACQRVSVKKKPLHESYLADLGEKGRALLNLSLTLECFFFSFLFFFKR